MCKVGLIGYYSLNEELVNGQTIKSKLVRDALIELLGEEEIKVCDYCNWKKRIFSVMFNVLAVLFTCKNIIILPAKGAINYIIPVLCRLNIIFRKKLHYYVVGGWLVNLLIENPRLITYLSKLDGIYVELTKMKDELENLGLKNVILVSKFRDISISSYNELNLSDEPPYKLCIFSRIMKEKGIAEAVFAVTEANQKLNSIMFKLDIYGQIYNDYEEWFENLRSTFPSYISYNGYIDYKDSNKTLVQYFAMLFPTYYYGEGYPNTIVDAFAAGLPVISTDWNYNNQVINDGIDGILYDLNDKEALTNILIHIAKNPEIIIAMKENALKRAGEFMVSKAIIPLINNLE